MTHAIRIHKTGGPEVLSWDCLLYTSDAADDYSV